MKSLKVAMALALAVGTPLAALADGNTGMLRGVVRTYVTGKPIANADVYWVNPSGIGWTRTDRNGRFYFLNVTPGFTTLSLSLLGFSPMCAKGSVNANETVDLSIGFFPKTRGILYLGSPSYQCLPLHVTARSAVEDSF
jgi:hypothetical protein